MVAETSMPSRPTFSSCKCASIAPYKTADPNPIFFGHTPSHRNATPSYLQMVLSLSLHQTRQRLRWRDHLSDASFCCMFQSELLMLPCSQSGKLVLWMWSVHRRMGAIVRKQVMVVQSKNISCCSFVACSTLIDVVHSLYWLCSPRVAAWQVLQQIVPTPFALCGNMFSLYVTASACCLKFRFNLDTIIPKGNEKRIAPVLSTNIISSRAFFHEVHAPWHKMRQAAKIVYWHFFQVVQKQYRHCS